MLAINDLNKIYKNSENGVKEISFQISKGEILCLAGPNGSGKTTLLNSILGIIKKDKGSISLFGQNVDNDAIKNRFAYISDEIILIEELTGFEYLAFIKSMYKGINKNQIITLLKIFDLEKDIDKLISSYSHGMKKKLQIISMIMKPFDVLVLDEPCRGLDVEAVYVLKKIVDSFKRKGKMILITSHDLLFIEEICDKILILTRGIVVGGGTPEEIKSQYKKNKIEEAFLEAAFLKERENEIDCYLEDYFDVIEST
ncbi:TPA: ABC transporter ATP-binding protein [Enterococcus faecium]